MSLLSRALVALCVCSGLLAASASANTSHDGWPRITGVLLMNKNDSSDIDFPPKLTLSLIHI